MEDKNVKGLRFFRVLLPDFSSKLLLPCDFINQIKGNGKDKATLLSPHGKMWDVLCYKENEDVYMGGESWLQFTSAISLGVGYFLVFHHKGDMVFSFRAFDLSTREIAYSSKKAEIVADNIVKEEDYNSIEGFEEPYFKKRKGNPAKKEDTVKATFELIMKSCNLNRRHCAVKIPERIVHSCDHLKAHNEMSIEDPNGRIWSVGLQRCIGSVTIYISKGWLEFAIANKLKEGNRCIFKLASQAKNHLMMKVKIVRNTPLVTRINPPKAQTTSNNTTYISTSSFMTTIKRRNLVKNFMHIPLGFVESNGLERCAKINLRCSKDRMWLVHVAHGKEREKERNYLSNGWLEFARANKLNEGDRCIFELVSQANNHIMKVKVVHNTPMVHPIKSPKVESISNNINGGSFSSFMTKIKPYNLDSSFMCMPLEFVEFNGLKGCIEMRLRDSKDRLWLVDLAHEKERGKERTYISNGWLQFAHANELKEGDRCIFELVQQAKNHIMKVKIVHNTPITNPIKLTILQSTPICRRNESLSSFTTTVEPYNLDTNFMNIPLDFVESNRLERCSEMSLRDPKDQTWLVSVAHKRDTETKISYISNGWQEFAHANELKEGDRCIFELASQANNSHIMNVKIERDIPLVRYGTPIVSPIDPPKSCGSYRSSSSFMTTITPYNLLSNFMQIPLEFFESNGLEGCSEMRLRDSNGQAWLVGLAQKRESYRDKRRIYISEGWRGFAQCHKLGAGDICIFEMVAEEKGNAVQVHVLKRRQLN